MTKQPKNFVTGSTRSAETAEYRKALRPRHVHGVEGSEIWAQTQNSAFLGAMMQEHADKFGTGEEPTPEGRPQLVSPAHIPPVGGASSLE